MVGFGENLRDQIGDINNYTLNGIQFLKDIRDFVAERQAIEQQYVSSMDKLAKNFQKKFKKSHQSFYGSGSSFILPNPESGDPQSTVAQAWSRIVTETENMAKSRQNFCDRLNKEVLEHLKYEIKRKEEARSKHMTFHQNVTTSLEISKAETEKARSSYRSAGKELDAAYARYEKAADDKAAERAKKEWNECLIKKIDKKNEYTLTINVYNAHKKRYYFTDVPKIMDHMQDLNEHVVQRVQEIFNEYIQYDNDCLNESLQCNQSSQQMVSAVNPPYDTEYFMKSVQRPWNCPIDMNFDPYSTSDSGAITVEPSDVWLLNTLLKLNHDLEKEDNELVAQKKTMDGILNLKDAYQKDPGLGDSIEVWQNFIESEREYLVKELNRNKTTVQIETIKEAIGDIPLKPHTYKTTQSGNCDVCGTSFSLFSKGNNCTECKFKCHSGCMVKVAPRCGIPFIPPMAIGPTSAGTSLTRSSSVLATSKSVSGSLGALSTQASQVRMLYDYAKQADGDLDVKAGDIIEVVAYEGNGWLRGIFKGVEGVVPENYTEKVENKPTSAPPSARAKVKAIYDYDPQTSEELALRVGDVIVVLNKNAGGGWWEGELNGKVGIFPENYVEPV